MMWIKGIVIKFGVNVYLPELDPEVVRRYIELEDEAEPPEEGLVDVVNEVGGEDDYPGKSLIVVEEDTHVQGGVSDLNSKWNNPT